MFNRECTGLKCARERKEWLGKNGTARILLGFASPPRTASWPLAVGESASGEWRGHDAHLLPGSLREALRIDSFWLDLVESVGGKIASKKGEAL